VLRSLRTILPGLALAAALTAAAYAAALLPGLGVIGPLVLALVAGLAWRAVAGLPARAVPGVRFAGKTVLKIGIVLLGIRLDYALLLDVGPKILLADVLVVVVALVVVDRLGRRLNLDRGMRLAIAVGTGICGASAIVAAVPILRATEEEAGVSISVISVLGTLAVFGYVLLAAVFDVPVDVYGVLVGATLQEVAQVVAAGYSPGNEPGDLALLVKLARVALLAPTLIVLSWLLRRQIRSERGDPADGDGASLPPLVPWFLIGFLAVGAINSLGVVPAPVAGTVHQGSLLLTAVAMGAIGLLVDLSAFRTVGRRAMMLGAAGLGVLIVLMVPYTLWAL
jgi:uncharacterized integral membrane protein (TIGR00698 family)